MAGGRNSPALFELIREKTGLAPPAAARPAAPSAPTPSPSATVEASPKRVPSSPPPKAPVIEAIGAAPTGAADPRPLAAKPIRSGVRHFSISTTAIGFALAGVVLLFVIAYSAGYRLGFRKGEDGATKELGSSVPLTDPLKNRDIPVNPKLMADNKGSQPQPKPEARKPAPTPTAPSSTGPVQPAGPPQAAFGTDPRVAGQNYLVLAAKIDRETAERAMAFFKDNGVALFALPVAKSGGGSNNAGPCTLYAMQGLTPEMVRSRSPERTELEDKVHRLGKVWQKEHKGQTDFSQTYWEKKKP